MMNQAQTKRFTSRIAALSIVATLAVGGCSGGSGEPDPTLDASAAKVKPLWANPGNAGGNNPKPTDTSTTTDSQTPTDTTTTDTTTTAPTTPTDTATTTNTDTTSTAEPTTTTDTTNTTDTATTATPVATNAVLYWQPPTTNTDGSPLVDLQGYHVYMGTTASNLARVASTSASLTSYTLNNLATGTYYFAVSAYNQAGSESDRSNTATKSITN